MNISNKLREINIGNKAPFEVILKRNGNFESRHLVHVVISDKKGRILISAGNPDFQTFIRSSLKPFQVLPLLSSGTAESFDIREKGIAISCGSHTGTKMHAREVFKILWNSNIDVDYLKCPIPQNGSSKLQHNCSGKHASFLATCKKMNWPLESYLDISHPLQIEINRRVAEILSLPPEELISATDDCGAPTLHLRLSQMACLYAQLGSSQNPEFAQIIRSMLSNPLLVSGEGKFDSELMKVSHGQLISKGGAEGIQCISRIADGIGLAIKAEDGAKRAKHAVAIEILKKLDWVTPSGLDQLEQIIINLKPSQAIDVRGELKFKES